MDKISQVMERYRLSAGKGGLPLSYAELGRRIGVSRTQAENFCKGRSIPSDEAVLRISQEIGYDDMRLMVLQHHDRAPGRVKQAWKQIMGRLENHRSKFPTMDPQILGFLAKYRTLSARAQALFLQLAEYFFSLSTPIQEHLVALTTRWAAGSDVFVKGDEANGP